MLTQETKRKIDTARDILVGKVPDPKAQVEQITTALIYKFMDDMDKDAIELGGKARFFTNGYEQYAWTKLMDSKLGGHERFDIYSEAIAKLSQNPHIPQLFRDIFKDAFLPYRSPETLNMFLKEINGFTYSHSEELGNAFEYLLSILGSQGDAGQFRTPRHIIDFIVAAVDPKKDETVCDPACGTAGFLISAYKHILAANDGKEDSNNKETLLTPDEKQKLMTNFVGYDISPDMVRLSKVNMYLHGFADPKIYEYDTLSSEERWDETFDVMLANPPFMTPKGGIRPHKRFGVQANRAEVLFVDYIKEHLRPNGRAGVIVPEGIIFQSGTAYKALRKALVEDGLLAVVSLPAGVFNPYAGVKTSILLFDNSLSKKVDHILFIKINNDGFNLGAQRRPEPEKNDLTKALDVISSYRKAIKENRDYAMVPQLKYLLDNTQNETNRIATLVKKNDVSESGDYNLSGDRYRLSVSTIDQKWPMVELGTVCEVISGGGFPKDKQGLDSEEIPFLKVSDMNLVGNEVYIKSWNNTVSREILKKLGVKACPVGTVIFPKIGAAIATNKKRILIKETAFDNNVMGIVPSEKILSKYLYCLLLRINLSDWASDSALPSMRKSIVEKEVIPLPPIEVQKEIVEQIEVKQQAIESAKAVIKSLERERRYFGQSLRKLEGVEMVELGELFDMQNGRAFQQSEWRSRGTPIIRIANLNSEQANFNYFEGEYDNRIEVNEGDLLFSWSGTRGTSFGPHIWSRNKGLLNQHIFKFNPKKSQEIDLTFAYKMLLGIVPSIEAEAHGAGGLVHITKAKLEKFKIPLPDIKIQKQMVEEAEKEERAIVANHQLIELMDKKIQQVLGEI